MSNRSNKMSGNGRRRRNKKGNNKCFGIIIAIIVAVLAVGFVYTITRDKSSDENGTTNKKNVVNDSQEVNNTDVTLTDESNNNQETSEVDEETTSYEINNYSGDVQLSDEILGLSTEIKSLGYNKNSTERDEFNRPTYIESMQNMYGKYNTYMIGKEDEKKIYLTFTIGTEYMYDGMYNTERIMNILSEKNIPAAFFVTGEYTERYPEMCKKIVDNGFIIGCHGYNHPSEGIASMDPATQIEDNNKIYNAIYDITGVHTKYYRPGSGIWNERSIAILNEMGFTTVLYSFAYYDYDVNDQPDVNETYELFVSNLHNGEILYLHTVSNTNVAILGKFIDEAISQGYTFGSVSELE